MGFLVKIMVHQPHETGGSQGHPNYTIILPFHNASTTEKNLSLLGLVLH